MHSRAVVRGLIVLLVLLVGAQLTACTGTSSNGTSTSPSATPPRPTPTTSSDSGSVPTPGPSAPSPVSPPVSGPSLTAVALVGAEPAVRFPAAAPASGAGANPAVTPISTALWQRMVGYSWTPGCPVGRSALREIAINYWGFDGLRHRGSLVVAASIASRTTHAFSELYAQRFRIRQMRPMDSSWGHDPKGPGADDYAAMDADNTSAFNCRYVGGEESHKVWSNHAYGRAIDINDFENPYVDSSGRIYPSSYFLHRRTGAGVFTGASSAAVEAFTREGFSWGGRWSVPDLQHMEIP